MKRAGDSYLNLNSFRREFFRRLNPLCLGVDFVTLRFEYVTVFLTRTGDFTTFRAARIFCLSEITDGDGAMIAGRGEMPGGAALIGGETTGTSTGAFTREGS